MKRFFISLIVCIAFVYTFTSCDTITYTTTPSYASEEYYDNIVVRDETCYVYYDMPSITFLNSLHIIDGYFYYWHINRYIPVHFPRWNDWKPYRYYYYNSGRLEWRDGMRCNNDAFRKKNAHPKFISYQSHRKRNQPIDVMRRKNISIPKQSHNQIKSKFGKLRKIPHNGNFGGRR